MKLKQIFTIENMKYTKIGEVIKKEYPLINALIDLGEIIEDSIVDIVNHDYRKFTYQVEYQNQRYLFEEKEIPKNGTWIYEYVNVYKID